MDILMTGGSGRIGGYALRELLGAGHSVATFNRSEPPVEGSTFLRGDITDIGQVKAACQGRDAVLHLAAVPGPGRATPDRLMLVNVMGTVNVLQAAVEAGVGQVVFASSGAATGFSFQSRKIVPRYLPIDEEHPCEPQDEYGLSKLLGELTCRRYTAAHGIRTVCLRINNGWSLDRESAEVAVRSGFAKSDSVEQLWEERYLKSVEDAGGDWPIPGQPRPEDLLWAVTDARDVAQAIRLALENEDIQHEVFHVNGSDTSSRTETPDLISRHFAGVPLTGPLQGHASLVSHEKATRLLGFRPRYTWRDSDFSRWLERRQGLSAP